MKLMNNHSLRWRIGDRVAKVVETKIAQHAVKVESWDPHLCLDVLDATVCDKVYQWHAVGW